MQERLVKERVERHRPIPLFHLYRRLLSPTNSSLLSAKFAIANTTLNAKKVQGLDQSSIEVAARNWEGRESSGAGRTRSQARLAMPYEHERTKNISAYRRIRSASRRAVDHNDNKTTKEHQLLELALRGSEQRWPLFTIIFVDPHTSKKVSPFPSPLPDASKKNNFESACPHNMDGVEPQSPKVFETDLQVASTDAARSNSACTSSEASSLDQSASRNKSSNSLDSSSSTSLTGCLISSNSSGSVCDNLSAVDSDFLVNGTPRVEKRVKRKPRKKGKKKGKQYKRTACRKVSTESNAQSDENIHAPAFETSSHSCLSSTGKHLLHNKLSDEATPPSLLVTDTTAVKDDSANSVDCSTTSLSCTSGSNEMDDSEPAPSLQRSGDDKFCCSSTTHPNSSSSNGDVGMVPITFNGSTREVHSNENNFHDNRSSVYMDNFHSMDGSNSDIDENCSDDTALQLLTESESRPSSSEVEMISLSKELIKCDTSSEPITVNLCNMDTEVSKNCCSSDAYFSNDVLAVCSSTERADCSNQAGSSNDFHPVISGKRLRRARRMIGNVSSNVANRSALATMYSDTRKNNNYSIWQKVQKIERKEGVSKPNIVSVPPHNEVSSKDTKTKMKLDKSMGLKQKQCGINYKYSCSEFPMIEASQVECSRPNTSQLLSESIAGNTVSSVESKSGSAVRCANQYHMSGSYTGKSDLHNASNPLVQQKESSRDSPLVNHNKDSNTGIRLYSESFSQRHSAKPTDSIGCCKPGPEKDIHVSVEESTPQRNVCNRVCHMILPAEFSEIDQMPRTLNQFDQGHIEMICENGAAKYCKDTQEDLPTVGIEDYQCIKPDIENYQEFSSSLSSTGSPIQKWVPIGRKDLTVPDIDYLDSLKASVVDETVLNQSYLEVAEEEVLRSSNSSSTPKHGKFSYPQTNKLTNKLSSYPHSGEISNLHAVMSCQTHETKDKEFIGAETDLDKITQAVSDAYKLQTETEGVQLVAGGRVADFEKFLLSASPVIEQIQCSKSSNSCSREQLIGESLCWHQIPNISLKSIWQWYEELSCFGLEVKAHDFCNSRRRQNGHFEFTAYFVPYLSAVQLFRKSRKTRCCNLSGGASSTCEVDEAAKSLPSLGSLPIMSLLLPRPHKDTGACLPESSCSAEDEFDKSIHVSNEELLFEYFESQQPPQRRPLYEKIKELVAGETISDGRIFGNPLALESVKLHDLHPASWYCVAWYPIYRIPDGNFHAAFLTYHSLGHFVRRSAQATALGAFTTVVSPVVGLQTYNDKGENWFQPRDMDLKAVKWKDAPPYSNTSELMKERLRTLKQTASVMARAVVCKGNQRSVNRHPDYEFFLSRSR